MEHDTPDTPEAECSLSAEAAAAWQWGWESGHAVGFIAGFNAGRKSESEFGDGGMDLKELGR